MIQAGLSIFEIPDVAFVALIGFAGRFVTGKIAA